jgi:hypothetical protein
VQPRHSLPTVSQIFGSYGTVDRCLGAGQERKCGDILVPVPTCEGYDDPLLWSLWDMMELKAGAFYHAATALAEISAWVSASKYDTETPFNEANALIPQDQSFLGAKLSAVRAHLATLGAEITLLALEEAENALQRDDATWGHARIRFDEIRNTLRRELSLRTLLVLERKEQSYYAPTTPHFGSVVAETFRMTAAFEIDEAAKCLALGRPTAAVFHLMRVMETSVRAVANCLGISDPTKPAERNWGFVLGEIRRGIEAKWPTTATRMSGDGQIFEALYASLDAVKNPWRNDTMHPASKYTDDEAEHIFVAVKGFMMKLASRCDENGLPLA